MQAACDEAGKVVKKQKVCAAKTGELLDQVLTAVAAARAAAARGQPCGSVVRDLAERLEQLAVVRDLNSCTKDLHSSISKLGKAIDKVFDPNQEACKPIKELDFDAGILNLVIAEHLFREGRFDLADVLVEEADIAGAAAVRERYTSLHRVVQQIRARDLGPALAWAEAHREQLSPEGGAPSAFEFKLHALSFINTLTNQGVGPALQYAQQHLPRFKDQHIRDIQRLMGCLVYAGRPPEATPYADLLSPCQWDDAAREFTRQACNLLGQATESPLAVAVAAGAVALPALQKMAAVMAAQGQDLGSAPQLPIELELGPEFVYHSIFACPVSREQSTPDNPPKLLPCNHVLCEQSILKIAKARSRIFKCPYCPMEARADNCRSLVFPDLQAQQAQQR